MHPSRFDNRHLPAVPALPVEELHLWLIDLARATPNPDFLNAGERDRAARYHFAIDRQRFITRRAILRQLLGAYRGCEPASIELSANAAGKLGVTGDLEFNLSSAGELALYGFCRGRAVGVDLAIVAPDFAWAEVAESFYHPAEVAYLRANVPGRDFFRLWTIKEAFVKATGGGLGSPLAREDFTALLRGGQPVRELADGSRWEWAQWEPTATTVAAVVVRV
ncbi:MAG: hypothetical protein PCFJNLEI_02246 [Verrucomicrobiae bacterium]|nr:hypothetical protein [Verrucomicrobiae bacterium]